jgi:hypothetical protein
VLRVIAADAEKVFTKMKFEISREEIEACVNCVPGVVEYLLMRLQACISEIKARRAASAGASATGGSSGSLRASATLPGGAMSAVGAMSMSGFDAGAGAGGATGGAVSMTGAGASSGRGVGSETAFLVQKEQRIQELEETNEYLELKIKKLEQLVRLKDNRIATLQAKLHSHREGLA